MEFPNHQSALQGNAAEVERLVATPGFDVDALDDKGRTMLLLAVLGGHADIVQMLLDKGADRHIAGRTRAHGTPLHVAVTAGNTKIVEMLLGAGASPFVLHQGRTPLDIATQNSNPALMRRLDSMGLFHGWLRHRRSDVSNGSQIGWQESYCTVVPTYTGSPNSGTMGVYLRISSAYEGLEAVMSTAVYPVRTAQALGAGCIVFLRDPMSAPLEFRASARADAGGDRIPAFTAACNVGATGKSDPLAAAVGPDGMAIAPPRGAYSMRALSRRPAPGAHDGPGAIKEDPSGSGKKQLPKEHRKSTGSPAVSADLYLSARQRAASAEAELRRLRSAYDARSALLADLSHDLRNALTGILGLHSLMEKTVMSPEQQQVTSLSQAAADQALATANGMLDLGRAEMGTLELDSEDFDVRALAEDAIDTVIVDSFSRGFDILCFVEPNVPEMARGCAPRIKQVIVALLRFLQQGNVEVIVGLESESARDHTLFISVTDETVSGEAFHDLVQRFHSSEHHTADQPGLGVSMLLAKRLVELMGGSIELRAEEGGGATASFTVLCQRTRGSRPALPGPLPDILSPALLISPTRPAHAIVASLSSWGVETSVVESVAEAITALENRSFGSVLVSLSSGTGPLSARSCAQVLSALRGSNPKKAHFWMALVPIPYTAQARDALAAAGEDSWAIIAKPLRMRTFYANLSTVANRESLAVDTGSQPQTIKSQGSATLRGTALLVEDDRINLLAISRSLAAAGCTVETAVNGQEAVDKAKNGSYDIIFMDINMPVKKGDAATIELRAMGNNTPIVGISASKFTADFQQTCIRNGFNEVVMKPLSVDALKTLCSRFMRGNVPKVANRNSLSRTLDLPGGAPSPGGDSADVMPSMGGPGMMKRPGPPRAAASLMLGAAAQNRVPGPPRKAMSFDSGKDITRGPRMAQVGGRSLNPTSENGAEPSSGPFSLQDALTLTGGDWALLLELCEEMVRMAGDRLTKCRAAVASGDRNALRFEAEALSGAAKACGARDLSEACSELQEAADALDGPPRWQFLLAKVSVLLGAVQAHERRLRRLQVFDIPEALRSAEGDWELATKRIARSLRDCELGLVGLWSAMTDGDPKNVRDALSDMREMAVKCVATQVERAVQGALDALEPSADGGALATAVLVVEQVMRQMRFEAAALLAPAALPYPPSQLGPGQEQADLFPAVPQWGEPLTPDFDGILQGAAQEQDLAARVLGAFPAALERCQAELKSAAEPQAHAAQHKEAAELQMAALALQSRRVASAATSLSDVCRTSAIMLAALERAAGDVTRVRTNRKKLPGPPVATASSLMRSRAAAALRAEKQQLIEETEQPGGQ